MILLPPRSREDLLTQLTISNVRPEPAPVPQKVLDHRPKAQPGQGHGHHPPKP